MKVNKTILSFIFLTSTFIAIAQNKPSISLINTSLVGTENTLPFWFTANQLGKIEGNNQFINLSELNIQQKISTKNPKLGFYGGASIIGGINNNSYLQVNQVFAGTTYSGWQLTGGLFADEEIYGGLSTTNGSIASSLNARPYPKIRFGTAGFKPFFSSKTFAFKAEYDEGLLNDDRFVDQLKLHHKSLAVSI